MGIKRQLTIALSALSVSASPAMAAPAADATQTGIDAIDIISATYGIPGKRRSFDIADQVQKLCGDGALSCQIFCADSSFGRTRLGRKAVCRVTYSCGHTIVRSFEAVRDEPIVMRCKHEPSESIELLPPPPGA